MIQERFVFPHTMSSPENPTVQTSPLPATTQGSRFFPRAQTEMSRAKDLGAELKEGLTLWFTVTTHATPQSQPYLFYPLAPLAQHKASTALPNIRQLRTEFHYIIAKTNSYLFEK